MPKTSKAARRNKNQERQPQHPPQAATATQTTARPLHKTREMSPTARIISLIVGDILCFVIFATLGTDAHGKGVSLLTSIWVAVPFIAAWFIVSPWTGAFKADISIRPKLMLIRTALCWLAAWPVAMALRWLQVERVTGVTIGQFLSFAVVALIFNMAILIIWRWPFAYNNSIRHRGL